MPKTICSICSHCHGLQTKDKKLLEELAKENCSHLSPEQFVELFQYATKAPHEEVEALLQAHKHGTK